MPRFSIGPRASAALLGSLVLLVAAVIVPEAAPSRRSPLGATLGEQTNCTVVYAADASGAFAGNNEDEVNPLTAIWFVPGEGDSYGSAFVGYDDFVIQGGMNEAGLFFDGLAVRQVEVPAQPGKPAYTGEDFIVEVLSECDSVACVLERNEGLSLPGVWNGQALFGDRFGDSAIMEPLAVIPKDGDFQVATNFFQSEVPPAERHDRRYVRATSMLADAPSFSVDLVQDVMEATHQEGTVNTVYSTVYDLRAGVIHLSYFNDFTTEVAFDLADELAEGLHAYELSDVFPENHVAAYVGAPIRERRAAAIDQLGPMSVSGDRLDDLAGTYEAESHTLMVRATEEGLAVRRAWTPWVDVVALSPTEFARVTVDGAGVMHDQRLTFRLEGSRASLEISEEGAGTIVAMRTDSPAGRPMDWRPFAILLSLAALGVAVVGWRIAHARRGRMTRLAAVAPPIGPPESHR